MAIMNNYAATCRKHATNPEYPLELINSIQREFKQGLKVGGFIAPYYILEKIDSLRSHVVWCQIKANEQFAEQCDD